MEQDAPVSVLRCVAVSPRQRDKTSAWQSQPPELPRLPALKRTLQAQAQLPAPRSKFAEPFRNLARRQPPPLPSRWPAPKRRAVASESASARLARIALDATCELSEADLVVFVQPAAPRPAAAPRSGGTLADPRPRRRTRPRSRFVRWLQHCLGAAGRAR
ncbi:MAG TPA: hypothetical protein VFS67_15545 [Polyangiaceae bacterium]|jgi:hypothetical protein|nr:hypothetical protein [Polyangiaceae bacterium]